LIHQNTIKLADFGVSKKIKEASKRQITYDSFPYIDPKLFGNQLSRNNPTKIYTLNEKSDVYSVGMLLWEISSGKPPYDGNDDPNLNWKIFHGLREDPVPDTPTSYVNLYIGK
jgi:serine/threonine protein kinase